VKEVFSILNIRITDLFVRFPILKLFLDTCSLVCFQSAAIIWGMRSVWKGKHILTICRFDAKNATRFQSRFRSQSESVHFACLGYYCVNIF